MPNHQPIPQPAPQRDDGRLQRSARSREQLVEALVELVGEGVVNPTAHQIAERVGLTSRSVFRLFQDLKQLHLAMARRLLRDAPRPGEIPDAGPIVRLRGFVAYRARLFEWAGPYLRANAYHRAGALELYDMHQATVLGLRSDMLRWLPELAEGGLLAHAFEQASSFEAWDRLRTAQHLGVDEARAVTEATGLALLRALDTLVERRPASDDAGS